MAGIYGTAAPGPRDVVAVFDADQAADFDFFKKMLPWMDAAAHVALVQSPQVSPGSSLSSSFVRDVSLPRILALGLHPGFICLFIIRVTVLFLF